MSESVKVGLGFGLLWALIKTVFYLIDPLMAVSPAIYANIFLLLCAISIGLYRVMIKETIESNLLNDIKNGMKSGLSYTVVVAIFIYLFYAVFNPGYNRHQIAEAEATIEKMVNNPSDLAKLKEANEAFELKGKEEILAELKKGPKSFFNAGSTFTLSLLAMLLLSTLYSIFVSLVFRKIVFKKT
ncbi:MAG: DUF4199 domain-containing protein [Bacteroidetes bacterium]|nr:DUF4199 domain-containing protein [Bacteroidota bacterium]